MNFLNRKMFSNGGGANQGYVVLTDGSTKYYDPLSFEQQLKSPPDRDWETSFY